MTGFIRGLFGGSDNQPKEDFFLDQDAASSLGDVDFMRKSKTVKRSYPKAAGKINLIEGETEKAVSSMQIRETGAETKPVSYSAPVATPPVATPPTATVPAETAPAETPTPQFEPVISRTPDSGMNMFRDMARNIKKR
ncbi:hypothetical protein [Dapis sp. BLCC M172]|uniref:hypothetical protein n=1 Tax=Dapis sp. BLCC M172 TaxID=2975281 RepID=UPI003CFB7C57